MHFTAQFEPRDDGPSGGDLVCSAARVLIPRSRGISCQGAHPPILKSGQKYPRVSADLEPWPGGPTHQSWAGLWRWVCQMGKGWSLCRSY